MKFGTANQASANLGGSETTSAGLKLTTPTQRTTMNASYQASTITPQEMEEAMFMTTFSPRPGSWSRPTRPAPAKPTVFSTWWITGGGTQVYNRLVGDLAKTLC